VETLATVHRGFLAELERADDTTPMTANAPVEMVVRCASDSGEDEPVHWLERLDWKAYAIVIRVHSLEHVGQIQRTLASLAGGPDSSREASRSGGPGTP
jgi:hypothetical protein